ncbi:MAG TPA: hypothetical protein VF683_11410, partial [Chthoniobacterales bacterium]
MSVTSDFAPASGSKHLVLDDQVDDEVHSISEATLKLDLTYKKNVVLTFAARSLGNEPNNPPTGTFSTTRSYDGVAISVNGGSSWRIVQSLANVGTTYATFSVPLDPIVAALSGSYGQDVRIRFSEFDNSPAPLDGIAIDEVVVTADDDPQSLLELPSPLFEGTGPQTGYVLLSFTPTSDLTLNLVASPSGQLVMPASVVVPAGQNSASFEFSAADDAKANLTRDVSVTATAPGLTAKPANVTIYDDEAPKVTVTLPAEIREGVDFFAKPNTAVTLSHPADATFSVRVSDSPYGQLNGLDLFVYFNPGQTRVEMTVNAWDDFDYDGDVLTTVTASAAGIPSGSAQTVVVDDEVRALVLSLPPGVQEDGTATGAVRLQGYSNTDVVVQLQCSDPGAASIPSTVTIPAGSISNQFTITGHDNAVADGSRSITITAQANGFGGASGATALRDDEVGGYLVRVATDVVDRTAPVSFTVSATDIEGNKIIGPSGTVNVELERADGSRQPANPPTLTLAGSDTAGTITLPPAAAAPLRIRVTDGNGRTGQSPPFDLMSVVSLTTADLVWDPTRQRIYASVPASAPTYANQVIAINPTTGQITGSVTTGHNPGQLALTSGGEALYVALNANGSVARINPATMAVVSSFPLASGSSSGPFFAADMCTVKDQPNVLVVVRKTS